MNYTFNLNLIHSFNKKTSISRVARKDRMNIYRVSQATQIFMHWYLKAFDITLTALMIASLTNFLTVNGYNFLATNSLSLSLSLSFFISLVLSHSSLIYLLIFHRWVFVNTRDVRQRRGFKKNPPARFSRLTAQNRGKNKVLSDTLISYTVSQLGVCKKVA